MVSKCTSINLMLGDEHNKGLFGYSYPMWIGWDWKKI
jgi:hypothetical protein